MRRETAAREAVVNTKVAEGFQYWVVTYLRHFVPELWSGEARYCAEAGAWHRLVKASSSPRESPAFYGFR